MINKLIPKFSFGPIFALTFALILSTCAPSAEEPDCGSPDVLCVGLVTDVGSVDDKSFNQSSWQGVKQSESEFGAKTKYIETKDAKDYMTNIELFANRKYDVIVTVGFGLSEATAQAAQRFTGIKFIGVDQFQVKAIPNVVGLIFHEDRAGFMAGALAAMLSESGKIAAVLGTDLVPPVVAFKNGYEAGARYIQSDIKVISTFHPADVVFAAGGTTGNGGLIEVASHPGKYCIGVDTDQWNTVPEARPCLVSCAMKLIAPGVFDLIKLASEGKFPSGNFFGDVGLAPFHDFDDKVSLEIKEKLAEIDTGLKNGSIQTK
jgi:basic membrane protein A